VSTRKNVSNVVTVHVYISHLRRTTRGGHNFMTVGVSSEIDNESIVQNFTILGQWVLISGGPEIAVSNTKTLFLSQSHFA
jgi:hypothetical protein